MADQTDPVAEAQELFRKRREAERRKQRREAEKGKGEKDEKP